MKNRIYACLIVCLLLPFSAIFCSHSPESPLETKTADLQSAPPAQQGLDQEKMAEINRQAAAMPDLSSLLILRNGYLVSEQYFHGSGQSTAFNVKSVSKSFLSALIGIAIREGKIGSPEQKIADFLPDYLGQPADPRKKEITIGHLLTMTAGFEWLENGPVVQDWVSSPDWIKFIFNLPQVSDPGRSFNYSTAGTHLLSAVISRSTKMSALEYANKYLFPRLGISGARWDTDPQGYCFGGAELYLTARDLGKFGLLYLNRGSAAGEQIVSEDWVRESTRRQVEVGGDPLKEGYGYLWWIRQYYGVYVYYAAGAGGQFIFCAPDLNMVVVSTSILANSSDQSRVFQHYISMLKLLDQQILPAAAR